MQPLNDTIYLKPIKKDTTSTGFAIADSAVEKTDRGTVVYAGPGLTENGNFKPVTVKAGDTVIFNKYSPDEVEIDGEKLLQLTERDIFAIL
jgi:chaperonin GroES